MIGAMSLEAARAIVARMEVHPVRSVLAARKVLMASDIEGDRRLAETSEPKESNKCT